MSQTLDAAFNIAVELEAAGDQEAAVSSYQALMSKDARAAVNLGVIHHNRREYGLAADMARAAVRIEPNYAQAWFNLGNALEELRRPTEAVAAHEKCIKLAPAYADAHFNLALLLDTMGQPRRAIRHWRAYVKLDPVGKWTDRGRRAIKKTLKVEKLQIVWRRPA